MYRHKGRGQGGESRARRPQQGEVTWEVAGDSLKSGGRLCAPRVAGAGAQAISLDSQ